MTPWHPQIRAIAEQHGIDPALALAVAEQESRFNPQARSPAGALGIMQLMPDTASGLGVDPNDPVQNITGGVRYLKQQLDRFGSPELALAAYNGGPARLAARGGDISRMPPETQAYVPAVQARMDKYAQADPFADLDAAYLGKFSAAQPAPADAAGPPADPFAELDTAYLQKFAQAAQQQAPRPAARPQSPLQNALAAYGAAASDLITGLQQRAYGAAGSLPDTPFLAPLRETSQRRAAELEQQVARERTERQPLLDTTAGKIGYGVGAVANATPLFMVPGANTLGGAALTGALYGALQPTTEGDSALRNAAEGAVWGAGGQLAASGLGKAWNSVRKLRQGRPGAAEAAAQSDLMRRGMDLGYKLPASATRPDSMAGRFIEGISGRIKTNQALAEANQPVTTSISKRLLGLSDDAVLDADTFRAVRQQAYATGYQPIRSAGTITADQPFLKAIDALEDRTNKLAKGGFGKLAERSRAALDDAVADLRGGTFDGDAMLDAIQAYREEAADLFRSQSGADQKLARLYRSAADMLEDLADRHLGAQGAPEAVAGFRAARQQIARSFDIQRAVNPGTGQVRAAKIGQLLEPTAAGTPKRPLTGDLKTIGELDRALRGQPGLSGHPLAEVGIPSAPLSPLDLAAGAMTGAAMQDWRAVGLPLLRPLLRSTVLSRPYQRLLAYPRAGRGLIGNNAEGLLEYALRVGTPVGMLTSE